MLKHLREKKKLIGNFREKCWNIRETDNENTYRELMIVLENVMNNLFLKMKKAINLT